MGEPVAPAKLDPRQGKTTSTLSFVEAGCSTLGPSNIFFPAGKCIIRHKAVLRGDLAKITLGKMCFVNRGVILHPASKMFATGLGFVPLTMGDFVWFGEDAVVRAASIGSCVRIGSRAVIGERCILKDACQIMDDAVVPPDTVIAPFTCWGGNPAALVKMLPESFLRKQEWEMEQAYAELWSVV